MKKKELTEMHLLKNDEEIFETAESMVSGITNEAVRNCTYSLISACMLYLRHYCKPEMQDYQSVIKLIGAEITDASISALSLIFDEIYMDTPNSLAVKMYQAFRCFPDCYRRMSVATALTLYTPVFETIDASESLSKTENQYVEKPYNYNKEADIIENLIDWADTSWGSE